MTGKGEVKSYLNSKVIVQRLPRYDIPPGPGAPIMKLLNLAQGELAQIWDGSEGIHYIAGIELRHGTVRGNHYHERKLEFTYIISGTITLVVQETPRGERAEIPMERGCIARISTRVAHVLVPKTAGYALEFSPRIFELEDTCPFPLVQPGQAEDCRCNAI
jgi:hypothetical protein